MSRTSGGPQDALTVPMKTPKAAQAQLLGTVKHLTLTFTDWSLVKRRHTHIVRDGALSDKVKRLDIFVDSKSRRASKLHYWFRSYSNFAWICWAESKDYSAHRLCGNCNLTLESPKTSSRWPQTPDAAIGPICCECHKTGSTSKY